MKLANKLRRAAYDDLQPVGSADPERDRALARHESGETEAQDLKRAKDASKELEAAKVRLGRARADRDREAIKAAQKEITRIQQLEENARHAAKDILPIPIKTSNATPMPTEEDDRERYAKDSQMTEYERGLRDHIKRLKEEPQSAMRDRLIRTAMLAIEKGITREDAARLIARASETEEIAALEAKQKARKITNVEYARLQILKQEQKVKGGDIRARDRGRFAKAKDSFADPDQKEKDNPQAHKYTPDHKGDVVGKGKCIHCGYSLRAHMDNGSGTVRNNKFEAYDKSQAKDSLKEQRSGSEPADHLHRAAVYEVQGDRARALDSYRMAATGYRKIGDRAGLAKATDGIQACQTLFAGQYDHPGAGRVRVCDSAATALRTALERTRAGEDVVVVGATVRPGRARVGNDTGGPAPVDDPAEPAMTAPAPVGDVESGPYNVGYNDKSKGPTHSRDIVITASSWNEAMQKAKAGVKPGEELYQVSPQDKHATWAKDGAFSKLESKLERKGESKKEAGAVAYEAGAKKYGKAGMAAKAAAGRAKDSREVQPV